VQDHIVHFYHLSALDWVDMSRRSRPTPGRRRASPRAFRLAGEQREGVQGGPGQTEGRSWGGELRHLCLGYWGTRHEAAARGEPDRRGPLLKALDYQRKASRPSPSSAARTPIPESGGGWRATAVNMENIATLNMERIPFLKDLMTETRRLRPEGLLPGSGRHCFLLQGVVPAWRRRHQLLAVPEFAEDTRTPVRPEAADHLQRRSRHLQAHRRPPGPGAIQGSPKGLPMPGTREPTSPSVEGRRNPEYTDFQEKRPSTPGASRPAFNGKPMQVGPPPRYLRPTPPATPESRSWWTRPTRSSASASRDYTHHGPAPGPGCELTSWPTSPSTTWTSWLPTSARVTPLTPITPRSRVASTGVVSRGTRGALSHWMVIDRRRSRTTRPSSLHLERLPA